MVIYMVLVAEVGERAAGQGEHARVGESGLHVWIGMVCVVTMSGRMHLSALGGREWPLGRGGAAAVERCQHRGGRKGQAQ